MKQINPNYTDFSKPLDEQKENLQECEKIQIECPNCNLLGEQVTCFVKIPHFQDQIIMSFNCAFCEYKSNEIKGANGYKQFGQKITLLVQNEKDLQRELYKSDCCAVHLPELELELDYGTLGSLYTTVEGLLKQILDNLQEHNPFINDNESNIEKLKMEILFANIQALIDFKKTFKLILIDPAGESNISQIKDENQKDEKLIIEEFERDQDQNEWMGISDINTENY